MTSLRSGSWWATTDGAFEPDIEDVAFHEAGHFVARHVLVPNAGFQVITVRPQRHAVGETFAKMVGGCQDFLDPTEGPDGVAFCETCAIGLYAGYAAQVKWKPISEERARLGAERDFQMAEDRIRRLYVEPPTAELLARSKHLLLEAAHQLVAEAWPAIEALARTLVRELTLDGMRARQIVAGVEDEIESIP
jgi:hypothetical protein